MQKTGKIYSKLLNNHNEKLLNRFTHGHGWIQFYADKNE